MSDLRAGLTRLSETWEAVIGDRGYHPQFREGMARCQRELDDLLASSQGEELCDCCEEPLGNATTACPHCGVKFALPSSPETQEKP